ncbi:MAG: nitrate reductase [Sulfurimonas sp.]|nr:nitrate reductase [Sulfurimonas sp.]
MQIKLFLLILLLLSSSFAKDIKPFSSFYSVGFVNDFVIDEDTLYVGNDMGIVDIFNIKTTKIIKQISLPPLTSSKNKIIPADILSVDYLDGKLLILSVGGNSFRNVWIYENNTLKQIINEEKKLTIKKASFINSKQILFTSIDSDITLYDTSENYNVYSSHISDSKMSDIILNKDKTKIFVADESGTVKIIDAKSSKIEQIFSTLNVDNIYKIAQSNGVIITAGHDRRVGIYQKTQEPYYIKSDFLVFCVGISPTGKIAIYSSGEESHLQLFNTKTKKMLDRLIAHNGIVNKIEFINEHELFSSQRGHYIYRWKLK